jgi:large subunit ribosomal protein L25
MQLHKLLLQTREATKKARDQRTENEVFGVVYGHGLESTSVMGNQREVTKLINSAGTSQVIDLKIGDQKSLEVLLKAVDYDPVTNQLRHFDFYAIKKGEKIEADVPVRLIGEAPAARLGNIVHQLIDTIEVRCLPSQLPEAFEVDINDLNEVGDTIHVSDIKIEEEIEIDEDLLQQPIVKVDAPREIEEEPEVEEELSAEDVESEHGAKEESDSDQSPEDDSKENKQ